MTEEITVSGENDDLAASLTAEALVFSFLNKVFYEKPTAEFINTQKSEALFEHWPLEIDDEFTAAGLNFMRAFSAGWSEEMLDMLRHDYRRLFVGPGHLPAPPWESVYLSIEGLVYEEQTMAVRQFYARYDLQSPKRYTEPDDHFGLEMAFMAHLCMLGLEAVRKSDSESLSDHLKAQRDFLEEHLLLWAPTFLGRVIDHARTEYYRGAAHLALGSINYTAQRLGIEFDQAPESQ